MKRKVKNFALLLLSALLLISTLTCPAFSDDAQNKYAPLKLDQEGGWTLAVIPDVQQYTSQRNFPICVIMMNWLIEHKQKLNILQAVCVGDLVNQNNSDRQWNFTSKFFAMLDGVYPYVLATGNHDYGGPKATADSRKTNFNKYFPVNRNPLWKTALAELGTNSFGEKNLENAAYETALPNNNKLVVIALPFAPTDANLEWAKKVAGQEKYKDAFVAVVTHCYIFPADRENRHDNDRHYKLLKEDGNTGLQIWEKLVKPSKNIRLVLCGHHSTVDLFKGCSGFRTDKNSAGKTVYQMVFDTQALGGGFGGNGGDGWLRLLEFSKDMKHVKVKTVSPFFEISPNTRFMAIDHADYNEFEFDID